jgi:hypothetical protein
MTSISGDPPNRAGISAVGVDGQQIQVTVPRADRRTARPGSVGGQTGTAPQQPPTSPDGAPAAPTAPAHNNSELRLDNEHRLHSEHQLDSEHRLDSWSNTSTPRPMDQEVTPPPAVGPAGDPNEWTNEPAAVHASNLRSAVMNDENTQTMEATAPELQVQVQTPTEEQPLSEMEPKNAERYFRYLDSAFADIDTHRGVMHGPMQWPSADTPPGQERVESLVSRLFNRRENPQNAYTTLVLYMPSATDPKRMEKAQGYATAVSRQLRTLVAQGTVPLATATALQQALTRHVAAGPNTRENAAVTRMFERKRLEVVAVGESSSA